MLSKTRGYSAGRFALELEGQIVGFVHSVEGGEAAGVVVEDPVDASGIVPKRIGSVVFEPIRFTLGTGMAEQVYAWMAEALNRTQTARDGAILFLDYNFVERFRLEWVEAFITEIAFPALDAGSKDAALLGITIEPASTVLATSGGKLHTGFATKTTKNWVSSNFRVSIDGLPTNHVTKVDLPKFSMKVAQPNGGPRGPGLVTIPNVRIVVAESGAEPFRQWAHDVLVAGSTDAAERNGMIEFLDSSQMQVLFTLELSNLGIVRVSQARAEAGAVVIATADVEMYCESMTFTPMQGATGSATAAAAAVAAAPAPAVVLYEALVAALAGTIPSDGIGRALRFIQEEAVNAIQPDVRARLVATRLRSTALPDALTEARTPKRADGESLGERWAAEHASLAELQTIAGLEHADWTAVRLDAEHSLLVQLNRAGIVPPGGGSALELERDAFVEGVITGAARLLRLATPHLDPVPHGEP